MFKPKPKRRIKKYAKFENNINVKIGDLVKKHNVSDKVNCYLKKIGVIDIKGTGRGVKYKFYADKLEPKWVARNRARETIDAMLGTIAQPATP